MMAWIRSNSRSSTLTPRSSLPIPGIIPSRDWSGPSRRTVELIEEVVETELLLADLALELGRLLVVVGGLGLLDQRHHIAHPEDPLGHPVGMEALELVELLAGGGEQDRLAGDRLDRQGGAAAGIAVELGHDHAVELDDLGELLGHVDGVLAGHGIDDEQDVVGLDRLLDVGQLRHQRLVDVEATAGVDDQHVLALGLRAVACPGRDLDRVAVGALLIDSGAGLGADLDQLSTAAGRYTSQAATATEDPCCSRR